MSENPGVWEHSDRRGRHSGSDPSSFPGTRSGSHPMPQFAEQSLAKTKNYAQALSLLLEPIYHSPNRSRSDLSAVWAEEEMQRAYSMVRLFGARRRREKSLGHCAVTPRLERALASDLALVYWALKRDQDEHLVRCSALVREFVANFEALFGPAAGTVTIRKRIERLTLPAFKRRALVLVVSELLTNALIHGFRWRRGGAIEVSLLPDAPGVQRLRVTDDGIGFAVGQPNLDCGVAAGLAGVLEGKLVYERIGNLTTADIAFPT